MTTPKKVYSADIETDGLNAKKVWVISITELNPTTMKPIRSFSLTSYSAMKEVVEDPDVVWIIHNGQDFDKPTLDRLITKFAGEVVDTLGLSWYLYPKQQRHGLAYWGELLGIKKPEVEDWENQELEVYIHRCEEDVKIQTKLWQQMWKHLMLLYKDPDKCWKVSRYLSAKMYALSVAHKSRWKLDVKEAEKLHQMFTEKFEEAKEGLEKHMPQVPIYTKKVRPKKPFKKDGTLSATGQRWKDLVEEHNKDFDYMGEIKHQTGWNDPNAGSPKQMKEWLTSLGWKPTIFDFKRDKETNEVRKIPQIKDKNTGELCINIIKLISKHPELEYLKEMSVVKHRISIVGGWLKSVDDEGFIVAGAQGFTNTLRLRHKTALNIPSVRKPYGKEIRGLLIARNSKYELAGSDMSSLEDRTKQHWMWPYDPEYVKDMMRPDFDPHTDMAVEAGLMTIEEVHEYNNEDTGHERKAILSLIRYAGKSTNYAATYGATGPTIARSAGVEEYIGEKLFQAYWKRNWSLKAIADDCVVKESRGMKWLWNPVAEIWYYLKAEKDRFSTLNQGTGSFLFDQWVAYILDKRPQLNGQFHDEIIIEVKKGHREEVVALLKEAIAYVNDKYKLNRELDVDIEFGEDYAEIH